MCADAFLVCVCVNLHIYMGTGVCAGAFLMCMYVCLCMYVHIYISIYIQIDIWTRVCARAFFCV